MAERVGVCRRVWLGSYSWSLVRLGVLPVTHVAARNHGRFYGILMEFRNSVADLGRDLNPAKHLRPPGRTALIGDCLRTGYLESVHTSHICHIATTDQGHFTYCREFVWIRAGNIAADSGAPPGGSKGGVPPLPEAIGDPIT